MKKICTIAAGLFLMAGAINSKAQYLSFGPVGGFGQSWVSNLDGKTKFKPSADLGIGILYSRNAHWGFGSSLIISHEGFTKEYNVNGNTYTSTVNPVYLRMPMYVGYFFGDYGNRVRPKIYVGPSIAVKIDEQTNNDNNMPADTQMGTATFSTFDLGVHAGAGANIRLVRNVWLNLDANYYQGLLDAVKNDNTGYNMNSNLRLNVGLMFGLK
ncbi:porin family protein [Chitinophagaceae bacterium MMS25-I14]